MTSYYVDTSALAKYYVAEIGTSWIRNILRPSGRNIVVICEITPIEMFSLLSRRTASGNLLTKNVAVIQTNFLSHISNRYLVQMVESPIFLQARSLVTNHKLRTLDAIQLAGAIHAEHLLGEKLTFLSGDNDLLIAASSEGFAVDNPNVHP